MLPIAIGADDAAIELKNLLITHLKQRGFAVTDYSLETIQGLGYNIDYRELRACDFGAPTIRKRFFMVMRCDGARVDGLFFGTRHWRHHLTECAECRRREN